MREDLLYTAYAIMSGFTIDGVVHFDNGLPHDTLTFRKRNVVVWLTARGWRVARLIDGKYEKPTDESFFNKLYPALEKAYFLALEESK